MLRIMYLMIVIFCISISNILNARTLSAVTEVIPLSQIKDYKSYPETTRSLIKAAYDLSKQNLTYMYGSANPKNKGMDCSGTIYYLLNKKSGIDIPRSSDDMYNWVKKKGNLHRVKNKNNIDDFKDLKPGDLLFWSGTYNKSGITHVMLYLGKNKDNQPLMFGSSDGRTYEGKRMWGVSVFDFILPRKGSRAQFVGYGCIPTVNCDEK